MTTVTLPTYRISGAIRNKRGILTHVQIDDQRIYPVADVIGWIRDGTYSFETLKEDGTPTPVSVRGKKFITTQGNRTLVDNLDYLPIPPLV
jgi:hypothetical protein